MVPVPLTIAMVAFGRSEDELELPFADGGVDWDPSLVFPGLRSGERLESQIELAPRAAILAADGTPLAEGPADAREHPLGSAAIDVTGEVGMPAEEDMAVLARHGFARRHAGRDQRPRAGLQHPARRQARGLAARRRRSGLRDPRPRRSQAASRAPR